MSVSRRWLHEPLVYFVALGTAVFALHRHLTPPAASQRIVLSESLIRGLRQDHVRRYGTPPTAAEEAALLQRYIDDEVLYREALALGLDRGDIVVRRRLVQKMEFLTEDMEPIPEPADTDLDSYLNAHIDRYAMADRVALTQVFVSDSGHAGDAPARAVQLRAQLLAGSPPAALGEPFLRGREFPLSTERQLADVFGPEFASRVMPLPLASWSDPIPSSYGWHLVRITQRQPRRLPPLAEVRDAVRRDWLEERRAAANRVALARWRQRYEIRMDGAALAAVPPDAGLSSEPTGGMGE